MGVERQCVPESGGPVTLTVQQLARSVPVTLPWTLSGGSTEYTQDWEARSGEVTFPAGATSATITLVPVDDDVHETTEPWVLSAGEQTIPVPLVVEFPFPAWATRPDERAVPAGPDPFEGLS